MNCKKCKGKCIRYGKREDGKQRYQCKKCGITQLASYSYKIWSRKIELSQLVSLYCEGVSIRGIARETSIPATSVLSRLMKAGKDISIPKLQEVNQEYEIDEMHTFVGNKENTHWVIYAINSKTRQLVDLVVSPVRDKVSLGKVIKTVLHLFPKRIYTDGLNSYPGLIGNRKIHQVTKSKTNHIERMNKTLREHLKRLCRKTLSFSKSAKMLEVSLKLYFHHRNWCVWNLNV